MKNNIEYRVTTTIEHAHPRHTKYPLLKGDILVKTGVQTYTKLAPGLAIQGFILEPKEEETLELLQEPTQWQVKS